MTRQNTRSKTDLTQMSIDSLGLSIKNEKEKEKTAVADDEKCVDVEKDQGKSDTESDDVLGHDSDDQQSLHDDSKHPPVSETDLQNIQKFDGYGDVETWLKHVLEKFDSWNLTSTARNNLVQECLTGNAMIWYIKQHDTMPTFMSFMKQLLQHYGQKVSNQETISSANSSEKAVSDCK